MYSAFDASQREIQCLNTTLEDGEWGFLAAFRTSNEIKQYINNKGITSYTSGPVNLPAPFNNYFDQYEYCKECDKYSHVSEKYRAYLVKKKHRHEFHFHCILCNEEDTERYEKLEDYIVVPLRLPCLKKDFPNEITRLRNIKNDQIRKKLEKKSEKIRYQENLSNKVERVHKFHQYYIILYLLTLLTFWINKTI